MMILNKLTPILVIFILLPTVCPGFAQEGKMVHAGIDCIDVSVGTFSKSKPMD